MLQYFKISLSMKDFTDLHTLFIYNQTYLLTYIPPRLFCLFILCLFLGVFVSEIDLSFTAFFCHCWWAFLIGPLFSFSLFQIDAYVHMFVLHIFLFIIISERDSKTSIY